MNTSELEIIRRAASIEIEDRSWDIPFQNQLVRILMDEGDLASAREFIDQLMVRYPDDIQTFITHTIVMISEGNLEQALPMMEAKYQETLDEELWETILGVKTNLGEEEAIEDWMADAPKQLSAAHYNNIAWSQLFVKRCRTKRPLSTPGRLSA
jgi:predicted Zn-dependent protease